MTKAGIDPKKLRFRQHMQNLTTVVIRNITKFRVRVMVLNTTFNNISVLLLVETGVLGEKPQICHKSHNVTSSISWCKNNPI
jgi:hypothetical protein